MAQVMAGTAGATVRVENGAGWQGEIETDWLRPVIKSPRELKTLRVRPEDLRYLVFMPPDKLRPELPQLATSGELQKRYPKAWAYIQWGEKQGYHRRSTCASRQRWWRLEFEETPRILWSMVHNDRLNSVICPASVTVDHNLFEITTPRVNELAPLLNTSFIAIVRELYGRANLGQGALKTEGVDIYRIPLLNPAAFTVEQRERLLNAFEQMASREVRSIFEELGLPKPNSDFSNIHPAAVSLERVLPDRRALDAVVFEVLGLNEQEQLAVYRAVVELVRNRLVKARGV